jgi:predicted DNA-binding transcriptional regulator AlpA
MIVEFSSVGRKTAHQTRQFDTAAAEIGVVPRGLSREQSARYIGISPSLFDQLVKDGRMPQPKRINARTVWDRKKIDEAFDALDDDSAVSDPWDVILKT